MTSPTAGEPIVTIRARVVCPHLRTSSGQWRHAEPSREHLCAAEAVAVPVGLETQRRLCLGDPTACERFRAARDARRALAPILPSRPIARTAPVVVDRGRPPIVLPRMAVGRSIGQAVLALAMIAAVVALILARTGAPNGAGGTGATVGPAPTPIPSASPPTPTPSALPTASVAPSPRPSTAPKASSIPVAGRTYRVLSGDTLSAIAAKFGTTVKRLQQLNGISDPSLIRVGQVLKIP